MKRYFLFFALLSLISGSLSAQTKDNATQVKDTVYQFTLQQAIEYAYEHQNTVMNAQLDEQIADAKVKDIRGIGLPQLTGTIDFKDFLELPTSLIPSEFVGDPAGNFIPIKFGTKYNTMVGLNASQMIFDNSFFTALKASRTLRELSVKNTVRTKIETTVAVSKAYYGVLINKSRMELIKANVERLKKLKEDTKALYDNGFVEKIDYNRVELAYNNMHTEEENMRRYMLLSEYNLKYQVGLNIYAVLTLTDSLNAEQIKNISISAEKPDVTKRIEYSILQSNKNLNYLNMRRYKGGYLPSIIAYGTLSTTNFASEFNALSERAQYYPTGIVGATLTWNILDGRQRHFKVKQASYELKQTENNIANLENGLNMEANASRTALQNALASFSTQEKNLELANEVSFVTKIKYEQGVGSNLEVITAETSLKEAQTNYYNALYNALVAKIDLDKALGNIK